MIVKDKSKPYSSKKTMIYGKGFVNTLRGIGSSLYQNKDLHAKLIGAVGDLTAFGLSEGGKALIRKIIQEKHEGQLDQESRQILESLKTPQTTGSGIKKF